MTTREDWLNRATEELRIIFELAKHPLPDKIRVSVGNPSRHARSANRAVGEWHSAKNSADGYHEIFISPTLSEPYDVFGVLIHELAHSATEGDGHRGRFPPLVKALGLVGKPTHTIIDEVFKNRYQILVHSLSDYPHASLNLSIDRKVQGTRNLKATCPFCNYTIRLTKTWADYGLPICPRDAHTFTLS